MVSLSSIKESVKGKVASTVEYYKGKRDAAKDNDVIDTNISKEEKKSLEPYAQGYIDAKIKKEKRQNKEQEEMQKLQQQQERLQQQLANEQKREQYYKQAEEYQKTKERVKQMKYNNSPLGKITNKIGGMGSQFKQAYGLHPKVKSEGKKTVKYIKVKGSNRYKKVVTTSKGVIPSKVVPNQNRGLGASIGLPGVGTNKANAKPVNYFGSSNSYFAKTGGLSNFSGASKPYFSNGIKTNNSTGSYFKKKGKGLF